MSKEIEDANNSPPSLLDKPPNSPPSTPCTPMNSPWSIPFPPMKSPPSTTYTPMNSSPSTPYTPTKSPQSTSYTPMKSPPSTPFPPMNSSPSTPYTPMDSPLAQTQKMNPDLDLPLPTDDYNSPLPLSVGPPFYKKRGNLYQKNSGTQRNTHEQAKVNQLLQDWHSNFAGILQENVSSLKKKLHLLNLQFLPSQRATIAVAEHILKHGPLVQPQSYPLCTKMPTEL